MEIKSVCKSVYIHIPFCKKICSYCDFCKFIYNDKFIDRYLDSLELEINSNYKGEKMNTIYIGGGTPSSLNIDELKKLLNINKVFELEDNYEYTIEFNVEDISIDKLQLLKEYGVNRLSIGVESFDKANLVYLNRNTDIDIEEKINLAKKYFDNINIDLIYALPIENIKTLEKDLDKFISLDIPHISCYSLMIEEHTKLYNDNTKQIDEDLDYEMYKLIKEKLKDYNHYEISNYAKKGYESKHNLVYWNNEEYYGFGVGASSYIGNKRRTNSKSINKYINKIYRYQEELLSKEDKISLGLILGFRKIEGINIDSFNRKYNINILDLYNIKDLVNTNKLVMNDGFIYVNEDYLYIENELLVNFI